MNSCSAETARASGPLLQIIALNKVYTHNNTRTQVLKDISFTISRGDALAVIGPSGAGKTTLLNILGTLDKPSSGEVLYGGANLFSWNQRGLADFRNRKLGFIFQFHHLLPEFTALENTMMPALIAGMDTQQAAKKAQKLLADMGLERRLTHKQGELSGGEQQRVAVARALIMNPEMVLADEPTGNLDTHTGREVFNLLLTLNREMGMTLLVVTHNEEFARSMPRCITLVDGSIVNA
ncbi:MAG: ABC transporter ATP-binding protein [Pseudomonadota bacterium]